MVCVFSGLYSGVDGDVLVEDGSSLSILIIHHEDLVKCWVVDVLLWEWGDLGAQVRWDWFWLWLVE